MIWNLGRNYEYFLDFEGRGRGREWEMGRWGDWEIGRWGDWEVGREGIDFWNSVRVLKSDRVGVCFFLIAVLYSYDGCGIPFFVEGFGFSSFFVRESYENEGYPQVFCLEFV
jgi:hypothetical protein